MINFQEFINEAIKINSNYRGIQKIDTLSDSEIEKTKDSFKLKPGDPIILTGTKFALRIKMSSGTPETLEILKGEDVNKLNLKFKRWYTLADASKGGTWNSGNLYNFAKWKGAGIYEIDAQKLDSVFFAVCEDPKGDEQVVTLIAYNPKYKKGESKAIQPLDEHMLAEAAIFISKKLGCKTDIIEKSNQFYVEIRTYFVCTEDQGIISSGEPQDPKVAGPFKTKEAAEKILKIMEDNIPREGEMNQEIMEKLKFRVATKRSPKRWYVEEFTNTITAKDITMSLQKNFTKEWEHHLETYRGRVKTRRFGI